MSSKLVLTASAAALGIFGAGWLLVPRMFYEYWAIAGDTNQYMGRRYGAFMLGLMVISWRRVMRTIPERDGPSWWAPLLAGGSRMPSAYTAR